MKLDAKDFSRALEGRRKELSRDAARSWFEVSQRLLLERGENYEGRSDQAEVQSIVQSGVAPTWTGDAWEFGFRHFAAPHFEFGTEPHTITPNPPTKMLKFPWPGLPQSMREKFEPQWNDPSHFLEEPEVLLPEIEHPGTPELRFLRDSRDKVDRDMGGMEGPTGVTGPEGEGL